MKVPSLLHFTFLVYLQVLLLSAELAAAQQLLQIDAVQIEGNRKTKRRVFLNELGFRPGDRISEQQLEQAIVNIRTTNLFSRVDHELQLSDNGSYTLLIHVEEKWTTIPILKLASGGGVEQTTVGVYDPNLFGQNLEAGFQYQRLENTDSGVAWFKNPRLFAGNGNIDLQLWKIKRLRTKYQQQETEPVIKTGFLHSRDKLYAGYGYRLSPVHSVSAFYEYNRDSFSDKLSSAEVKAITDVIGLPKDTEVNFLGLRFDWGHVDDHNAVYVQGKEFGWKYRYGRSETRAIKNFWDTELSYHHFIPVFKTSTFAQRFLAGYTNTQALQYWHYLGGLDRIRGFAEDRFAGRYFWLSNTELRQPLFRANWYVVQAVGFVDMVSAAEDFDGLGTLNGASAGLGIRVVLPKVYRFVIRADYAQPIKKNDDEHLSLGVQHFF